MSNTNKELKNDVLRLRGVLRLEINNSWTVENFKIGKLICKKCDCNNESIALICKEFKEEFSRYIDNAFKERLIEISLEEKEEDEEK
jgi:hypothetical protein